MTEDNFEKIKEAVLARVQSLFEEMEREMAVSHQEKYALLEDAFESASDEDELRVAFGQWFSEHADELDLDYENAGELWAEAVGEDIGSSRCDDSGDDRGLSEEEKELCEEEDY